VVQPWVMVSTGPAAKVALGAQVAMEPWAVLATPAQLHTEATAARPRQRPELMAAMAATVETAVPVGSAVQLVEMAAKLASWESVATVAPPAARAMAETAVRGSLVRTSTRSADPVLMAAKVVTRASRGPVEQARSPGLTARMATAATAATAARVEPSRQRAH